MASLWQYGENSPPFQMLCIGIACRQRRPLGMQSLQMASVDGTDQAWPGQQGAVELGYQYSASFLSVYKESIYLSKESLKLFNKEY